MRIRRKRPSAFAFYFSGSHMSIEFFLRLLGMVVLTVPGFYLGVKLADLGVGLPFLWTAKCAIVQPPESLALDVKTTEDRLFVRAGRARRS